MLVCNACGEKYLDDQVFCGTASCQGDLVAADSTAEGGAGPVADSAEPAGAGGSRDAEESRRPTRSLALEFADGGARVLVEPGSRELLGRHPALSKVADRLIDDTVSRRHATIGVDPDGRAWIRDEFATNGTSVGGAELDAGAEMPLKDGDRVRLGELTFKVLFVRGAASDR
jgi:FHA domain-containing protein